MAEGEILLTAVNDKVMEEKVKAYGDAVALFYEYTDPDLASAAKSGHNQKKVKAIGRKVGDVGLRLSLFGSKEVVKAYTHHRLLANGGGEPTPIVDSFVETILAMRKDLHGDAAGELSVDQILGTFLVIGDDPNG